MRLRLILIGAAALAVLWLWLRGRSATARGRAAVTLYDQPPAYAPPPVDFTPDAEHAPLRGRTIAEEN